ncbi:MAG: heme biosynthesis HemY N-terminal domain-containing protein [Haliea sp.]|uniref:heme biosynthesis HemY N-terminal domain-containing protein n=1 Tax=Haliea sp. TaxID=1932666 RepID=UPI0032EE7152
MRKLLLLALIALLLGVAVVALIENHPGYVLIAYGNYTVETSLWVGIVLLVLATLVLYAVFALLRKLLRGQRVFSGWLGQRKTRQASRLTHRGLISFIEGNWEPARRQLLRGAEHSEVPLLNYLVAARASFQLGDHDRMREYLGAAEKSDSEAGIAVELTQAELKLRGNQYEQAVATLERARRNAGKHPHVLKLLSTAYLGLEDWEALLKLLPELRKYHVLPEEELLQLERQVYTQLLQASVALDAAGDAGSSHLQQRWQTMPRSLRQDSAMLQLYVGLLVREGDHAAADKTIQRALKQDWDSELARLYGYVELDNPGRQLAQAETWLAAYPRDPQLLLSLGRLACRHQLWGKARNYFEASYKQRRSPEVCAELGRLLAALGEERASATAFREGLLLREKNLPQLPLPERSAEHA